MKSFKKFVESKYKKPQDIQVGDLLDGIDAPYKVIKVDKDHFITRDASGAELVHEKKGGPLSLYEDKEYTAFVRDKETGHATQITRTYPSMRDFKSDLRANGYRVMSIAPSNEVGSAEWERKLYDQRNKKKERKFNRALLSANSSEYARNKTEDLYKRWIDLHHQWMEAETGSDEATRLANETAKAYDDYKTAKDAAEAEYKAQHKK